MKRTILIALLLIYIQAPSQTSFKPISSPCFGMAAYSKTPDLFSVSNNQAALAQLKYASASIFSERRFMLTELSHFTATAALPTKSGGFAISGNYLGSKEYNQTQFGLVYGREMGKKLDIGAQFNFNSFNLLGYGSASTVSVELGTIFHITDKLHAGFHASNPIGGKVRKENEKIPSLYKGGFGYEPSAKVLIVAEIEKEENRRVNINAGVQYKIVPQIQTRLGISTATSSPWFGVALFLKSFRMDVTAAYHPQLGFTPGLSLLIDFTKKQE